MRLKGACRWLGSIIGYFLYAAGILALLLWLLVPKDSLRRSLEAGLGRFYPDMQWRIGTLEVALPPRLVLSEVEGFGLSGDKKALVRMEKVIVRPQLRESFEQQRPQAGYQVEIGKGSIEGRTWFESGQGDLKVEGAAQGVNLADISLIQHQLGRTVQGTVSGRFTIVTPKQGEAPSLVADIKVENGRVGLKQPILGHKDIPFSSATVAIHRQGEVVRVEKGLVESELLNGRFSGTIILHRNPGLSRIDIQGDVQPKKKFFKAVDNTLAVEAFRLQLKDNNLPFNISGTLMEPGIHFEEYAILFQKLEKELR